MEELLQRFTLVAHLAESDTQNDAEAYQPQHIATALVLARDLIRLQFT